MSPLLPMLAWALVEARLAAKHEQWQTADEALSAALKLCREIPLPYTEAKTRYAAGLVARQRGVSEQARDHFRAALSILERLGERLYAGVIQQALEQLSLPRRQAPAAITSLENIVFQRVRCVGKPLDAQRVNHDGVRPSVENLLGYDPSNCWGLLYPMPREPSSIHPGSLPRHAA
jgi:tetratricopeptide (TPR) repeat protein